MDSHSRRGARRESEASFPDHRGQPAAESPCTLSLARKRIRLPHSDLRGILARSASTGTAVCQPGALIYSFAFRASVGPRLAIRGTGSSSLFEMCFGNGCDNGRRQGRLHFLKSSSLETDLL